MDLENLCKDCWCNFSTKINDKEESFTCMRKKDEPCSFRPYLEKSSYIRK